MSFTPEQIARFGLIENAEASAFNKQSAQAQTLCGVDPADCIRIGVVAGTGYTPRDSFLGSLQQGIWISPASGIWHIDDKNNHWGAARAIHPEVVSLVVRSAEIGQEFLTRGKDQEAQLAVRVLHGVIGLWAKEPDYKALLAHSQTTSAPGFDVFVAYRRQIQSHLTTTQKTA